MKIDVFIRKHGQKQFPHAEELLPAIRNHACSLYHAPGIFERGVPISELLETYRRRAEHLKQFTTNHARVLQQDTDHLCDRLQHTDDSRCRIWIFNFPNGRVITVFEGHPSGEILGALKIVDKREISENEWEEIWGT